MNAKGTSSARGRAGTVRSVFTTLVVLALVAAVAVPVGFELTKTPATATLQIDRTIDTAEWPREWRADAVTDDYDGYCREQVETLRSEGVLIRALRNPAIARLPLISDRADPVAWLQDHLTFDFPQGGELLRIRLATHAPDDAAAIVDAIVDAYMQSHYEHEDRVKVAVETQLESARERLQEKIVREAKEINATLKSLDAESSVDPGPRLRLRQAHLVRLEQQLGQLDEYYIRRNARLHTPPRVRRIDSAVDEQKVSAR